MTDPKLISKYAQEIDPVEREFVHLSMGMALKAKLLLKEMGMTQGEFAASLGKKESEVSRWFSGMHNLTLYSIAKLHVALGRKLFDLQLSSLRPTPSSQQEAAVNIGLELVPMKRMELVWPPSDKRGAQAA